MTEVKSFLSDLDDAVARGTAESRKRALWHATDLLIAGRYSAMKFGPLARSLGG
jgi:hypothetical protein